MARRGEVLLLKGRLGFAARGDGELFVVVQDDRLGDSLLPTTIALPLDSATALYERSPWAVPVSAEEAGARVAYVAVATHPCTIALERFAPAAVGRLKAATLAKLDRVLRLVLGLS
ncbi:MAG: type II toxin-antitoxin system PemK/MazF family toxin [Deltaproteobacteria bacterium]|nr:type II toxin-antitoxin system PemK/MazF family toxin [Deltaproteobacteria bacterium]